MTPRPTGIAACEAPVNSPLDVLCPLCGLEIPAGCVCPPELHDVAGQELERTLRLTRHELRAGRKTARELEVSRAERASGGDVRR